MGFLLSILGSLFGLIPGLADTIGKTVVKLHETEAAKQGAQDVQGTKLAGEWLASINDANKVKAEVRAAEGTWGPMGQLMYYTGLVLVLHLAFVVLDSTPFPYPTFGATDWYIPYMEFAQHHVGAWKVAALPGKFAETEHMILQSLFYTGGGLGAATILAKAFRR